MVLFWSASLVEVTVVQIIWVQLQLLLNVFTHNLILYLVL